MKEGEEVFGLVFPASGETTPTFEPGEEAFDLPTAFVSAQRPSVLFAVALPIATPLWSNELNAALLGKPTAESAAVPRFVGNQSRRQFFHESSVESSLGEHTVVSVSSFNKDSEWKTMAVCNCHDLCRLAGTAFPNAGPPFFAGT